MIFETVSIELTHSEYMDIIGYYNKKSTPNSLILDKIVERILDKIEIDAWALTETSMLDLKICDLRDNESAENIIDEFLELQEEDWVRL